MKTRTIVSLLLACLLLFGLVGCQAQEDQQGQDQQTPDTQQEQQQKPEEKQPEQQPEQAVTVRVAALKGPTAMGMVKWMEDAAQGQSKGDYTFTLACAPDEITGGIVSGDYDVAAVPANLASVLYNKTQGKVQLAALNTLGVLYIVENGQQIQSIEDLRGKTIYATGKGSTPEYALNYILAQNGLEGKVSVEYKSEHGELAALLAQGQAEIALLPQPFVTTALSQNDQLRVALDLTAEWDKAAQGQSQLTMGCVIAQRSFVEENAAAVAAFLAEYEASVAFVTDAGHLDEAAALVVEEGILPKEAVAKAALPQCGITFVAGEEMKKTASGFLQVLYDADPSAVGGTLPDDGLYYLG